MSFADFPIHNSLLAQLAELKFTKPTEIQTQAIPSILAGKDVLASAQTGTGKTAAFSLPLLHKLLTEPTSVIDSQQPNHQAMPKGLILAPTRELAQQVYQSLLQLQGSAGIRCGLIYGGVRVEQQKAQLQAGVDIIVATPGRLLDLLRQRATQLNQIEYFVIDEADRMLDMGFRDELLALLKRLPKQRQTLLFSATLDDRVFGFSQRFLTQPQVIEAHNRNQTASSVVERIYNVDKPKKCALLCHLMQVEKWQQVLIFSRTKQDADALVKQMKQQQINLAAFHADLSQSVREQVLADFKSGKLTAIVATDVAARGIDIAQLDYVVNMELPFKQEDYVHRIGRTGRAGQQGQAITLLSVDDEPLLIKLETYLDKRLGQQWYPGFEPDLTQVAPVTRKTKKGSLKQQARQKALAQSKRR
ncbi:DEAD/DEAH box helicase [Shewanella gaetbuli]